MVGKSNYAINPTPEQVLRSNRAVLPARVIAALGFTGECRVRQRIRVFRVVLYTLPMLAFSFCGIDRLLGEESDIALRVEGNLFHEAPSCAKVEDRKESEPVYGTITREKARIEFQMWEECGRKFAGYAKKLGGHQTLVLTTEDYLKPIDGPIEVNFCHCPHRFVYELGDDFNGKARFLLLWRGNRIHIPGGET